MKKEYELSTQLFLKTAVIQGSNAYHPVTLEAEVLSDDYQKSPFKKFLGLGDKLVDGELYFDETLKIQKPKNFNSILKFMNTTYEKMPWFNKVRYNGEELTERLIDIKIKPSTGENLRDANKFRLRKYWVESDQEIYWRLRQNNNPEMTGDTSEYNVIIKVTKEEDKILTDLAKEGQNVIAEFDLGKKIEVRRETINDHFD